MVDPQSLGFRTRTEGTKMSKVFAERIIESMVDENGHCGERGLSFKQFSILSDYLEEKDTDIVGGWAGSYKSISFTSTNYVGRIGKYQVVLNLYRHFNDRCTVVSIDRMYDESEQQLLDEYKNEMNSYTWNHEVGERIRNMEVTCRSKKFMYETDFGDKYMYQFTDGKSLFVWFTGDRPVNEGDHVVVSMTVKQLNEYKGTKQTVVTRARIAEAA